MSLKSACATAVFGFAMLAAGAASATTIYDSKTAWMADAGSPVINTTSNTNPADPFFTSIALADGSHITTSDLVSIQQIGSGWSTWSGGYTGFVYQTLGNEISISLSGFHAFAFEVEPDSFGVFNFTVTLSDGSTTIDYPVDGSGGAQFFGWVADNIDKVTISTNDSDFAFGNIYSVRAVGTPEPLTLALFGAGLAGVGAIRRRKQAA